MQIAQGPIGQHLPAGFPHFLRADSVESVFEAAKTMTSDVVLHMEVLAEQAVPCISAYVSDPHEQEVLVKGCKRADYCGLG